MSEAVFITGGSRGIGRACALAFAAAGYDIIINYLQDDDAAQSVKRQVEALGRQALLLKGDVGDDVKVAEMVAAARVYYKQITVLINNAGIAYRDYFDAISAAQTRRIVETNVLGVVNVSRALLPYLAQNRCSFIINISSCWGRVGAALEVDYSLTKGAVNAFTKALAKEVASRGIRVNAIAPGAVETDMLAQLSAADRAALKAELPLSDIATPSQIAAIATFLVGPAGCNMTGEIIGSSGGLVI